MALTLMIGPVGCGKTAKLLEEIAPFAQRQSGLFLVPSDAVALELRQLALINNEALLGDIFVPFNHFIKKLAEVNRPIISSREQTLLLYKLLSSHKLRYFKSPSVGIAKQAAEAITTLKKNFITPSELQKFLDPKRMQREKELLILFERYEEEKDSHGFSDEGDITILAAKNIGAKPKILDGIEWIAFDEFHDFNPGQLRILELLTKHYKHIRITVSFPTTDDQDTLFASYLDKTRKRLEKLASEKIMLKGISHEHHVRNIVLRSPLQQIRFLAQEIERFTSKGSQRVTICTKRGDRIIHDIVKELEPSGCVFEPHRIAFPLASPVLHEILSSSLIEALPRAATLDVFASTLRALIKKMHDDTNWETILEKHETPVRHDLIGRSLICLSRIDEILSTFVFTAKTLKLKEISREMFVDLMFNECNAPYASASELQRISDIRFITFEDGPSAPPDILFVPDMIEEKIPSAVPERLFFSSQGGDDHPFFDLFISPERALAEEAYLFDRIIRKTKGEVILSHPAIDHSGDEVVPSSFLDSFGKAKPLDVPIPLSPEIVSRRDHLTNLAKIEQERLFGDPGHPSFHGCLQDQDVRAMIKERFTKGALSPSSIETYANCPFKFFVERVLNLKPPEEITPEIQPKDRGTIVHAILERFYRDHLDVFKKAVINEIILSELDRIIDKIIEDVFEDYAKMIQYSAQGLMPNAKSVARTMARQVIYLELHIARAVSDPLYPIECEWVFGKTEDDCLRLPIDGSPPALIRGRVDRIDASSDRKRFAVVDYKTGKRVSSVMSKIKKGLHVQLPLYVESVRQLYLPDAFPLGGMLVAVQSAEKNHGFLRKSFNDIHYSVKKRSHSILEDAAWDEAMKMALTASASHVAAIRNANFIVRPKECPHHCDYEDVCRYSGKSTDELPAQGNRVD